MVEESYGQSQFSIWKTEIFNGLRRRAMVNSLKRLKMFRQQLSLSKINAKALENLARLISTVIK